MKRTIASATLCLLAAGQTLAAETGCFNDGAFASAATLCLLSAGPAPAAEMACFSDGAFVYLHVGSTYQFYRDKGDPQVACTPEAVRIGLELTEDAAQRLCAEQSSICQEKQGQANQIRETYADLLRQSADR